VSPHLARRARSPIGVFATTVVWALFPMEGVARARSLIVSFLTHGPAGPIGNVTWS